MRRTKIVATIGPASRDPETLVRMIEAGMDVARLNFSHGTAEEHAETAQRVRDAAGRAGRQIAILQDLPGPKLRIGKLRDGLAELKPGDEVTFVCGAHDEEGDVVDDSHAAFEAHLETPHLARFRDAFPPLIVEERPVRFAERQHP